MKSPSRLIPWARRGRSDDLPAVIGSARLDHRTKDPHQALCPLAISPSSITGTWTG